ncbi:MAG: TonB-dependent receptor [Bacteroidota bacterium]
MKSSRLFLSPMGVLLSLFVWLIWTQHLTAQSSFVSAQVVDQQGEQTLGFASASLHKMTDSVVVAGGLADSSGLIYLENIPAGSYYLEVRFLGYHPARIDALETDGSRGFELGRIGLQPTAALLEEIEITGQQSRSIHQIDRQVYDAQQFQAAKGGTATDLIKNLPGVSVNAEGEIFVRGTTGFILMIDGRPVQTDAATMLSQLPANAVEDIEILTTPSARFDPDGKAGIINLTTRKGAADGVYLIINGLWGLPSIEPYDNKAASRRFGGDMTLNYRKDQWDLSLGLDYRRNDVSGRREGYVNTWINHVLTEFPSDGERSFDRETYTGRASVLYEPSKRQTFGLSVYAGKRTQFRTADILYAYQQRSRISPASFAGPEAYWTLFQQNQEVFQGGERIDSLTYYNENLRVRRGDFLIGAFDHTFTFADQSQLQTSLLYERTILGGPTDNANLAWPQVGDSLQYQFNTNDNPLDGWRFKMDYQRKLKGTNWSSGYQYRFLSHPGDFLYLERDFEQKTWITNPEFTNRIELKRQIHALYSQISGQHNKLSYSVGLRLEYMDRTVATASPDTTYELRRFSPFPSVNLLYDLGKGWTAKGGYSRRIQRTTTFKMTPFPEREHSETLEQGDAELLPEFIDVVELGLVKQFGDNSVFATAYYRHVQNVINRVNTIYNDSILNRIYTNAGTAQAIGIEVGTNLYPTDFWKLYLGTNVYNYQIEGTLFGDAINTANTIFSINANTDFSLPYHSSVQIGLNYLSERITAQGRDSRFYNPSLVLRKKFPQKRISLSLQWQQMDLGLLESNEQRITTVRDNFFTTTNYVYEVDVLLIGISYQLNQASDKMKFIDSEFGKKEF